MSVTEAVGRTYASATSYRVSREKISEFAAALSDPHPAYRFPEAARAHGHPDVVAPPTFTIVVTFGLLEQLLADPELGFSLSRVVHADQKFSLARPVRAGDELVAELSITRARPMGAADLLMTTTTVTTVDGTPVAETAATILHRRLDTEQPAEAPARAGADESADETTDKMAEAEEAAARATPGPVPRFADRTVGEALPPLHQPVRRADLVRYAGASGDFNPIHWSDRAARAVGLPGVIAHGMLTMGLAARVVTDWVGDPGRVVELSTRFAEPVRVPDDDHGVRLTAAGTVAELLADERVRVDLEAAAAGRPVLSRARAIVQL